MKELDYEQVRRYWQTVRPSTLGTSMMEGFGFPSSAGTFRFQAEARIVRSLTAGLDSCGAVLDLGSGTGCWAEEFAGRFAKVDAVEASPSLYAALQQRCAGHPRITAVQKNVLQFEPEEQYELIFLGGLLMYLNEPDVVTLLHRLSDHLAPGGMIVCRETTVRRGAVIRDGDYQAAYRSVPLYTRLFAQSDLRVEAIQRNTPYIVLQMGCEFMKKWKAAVPAGRLMTSLAGQCVYRMLRVGYPWIADLPKILHVRFPQLTNHFFVLRPVGTGVSGSCGAAAGRSVCSETT